MKKAIFADIELSVTDIADEFWNKTAYEKLTILSCLDTRFFNIPIEGEQQFAKMYEELAKCSIEKREKIRHIVTLLYKYFAEE